jgi:hypothetical protein
MEREANDQVGDDSTVIERLLVTMSLQSINTGPIKLAVDRALHGPLNTRSRRHSWLGSVGWRDSMIQCPRARQPVRPLVWRRWIVGI